MSSLLEFLTIQLSLAKPNSQQQQFWRVLLTPLGGQKVPAKPVFSMPVKNQSQNHYLFQNGHCSQLLQKQKQAAWVSSPLQWSYFKLEQVSLDLWRQFMAQQLLHLQLQWPVLKQYLELQFKPKLDPQPKSLLGQPKPVKWLLTFQPSQAFVSQQLDFVFQTFAYVFGKIQVQTGILELDFIFIILKQ